MWDWILILSLLLTGLLLIIIEILFVPGTTLVGLFGFAFTITAVFAGYNIFGAVTGHYILSATLGTFILAVYFAFRSDAWTRFANKAIHTTKVNEGSLTEVYMGMIGKALSDLKPVGKAELNQGIYEVTSENSWIDSGTAVKVVKLKNNKIFVEPLTV